jgi:diguanylate cyclase
MPSRHRKGECDQAMLSRPMQREILMTLKDMEKSVSAKEASLGGTLKKNEKIKQTVKNAATELTSVNEVLKQEKAPARAKEQALTQNEDVEQKIAKAADDLNMVNVKLAEEVAERVVIETELAATKTDLAEARDDLSKAQVEGEIQQIALQDTLAGIPNPASFEQGLDHGLVLAKQNGWGLSIQFLDSDKFKNINNSSGHDLGDHGLLMPANRLQSSVRDENIVRYIPGDEFACLLLEARQEEGVTSYTRSFRASFTAPKPDIEAWIKDSPELNETTPEKLSDNKVQYLIVSGSANTTEVTIDYGLNQVEIYVFWS